MYQDKIDALIALLKERNAEIGEGNPGYVDLEKVPTLIKAYDARKEEDLRKLNWDAILDILEPAYTVKPLVRPKLLAEKIGALEPLPVPLTDHSDMTVPDLISPDMIKEIKSNTLNQDASYETDSETDSE